MKRFLINVCIFLCLLLVYDAAWGAVMLQLRHQAKSDEACKNNEVAEIVTPDVLILGSSRAVHHFVPSIVEDMLGCQTYVAGQDGNGIVMMNPVLHYISARHKPKVVIYDLTQKFDIDNDDPHTYLRYIRTLWGRNDYVDSVICLVDPLEKYKLQSQMFRYNSHLLSLIKGCLKRTNTFDRGYSPLYGHMDTTGLRPESATAQPHPSPLKIELLKEMISYCHDNDIRLYFTVSPSYGKSAYQASGLMSVITDMGGTVLNFYGSKEFEKPEYYQDEEHLNHTGACIFTDSVMTRIIALQNAEADSLHRR